MHVQLSPCSNPSSTKCVSFFSAASSSNVLFTEISHWPLILVFFDVVLALDLDDFLFPDIFWEAHVCLFIKICFHFHFRCDMHSFRKDSSNEKTCMCVINMLHLYTGLKKNPLSEYYFVFYVVWLKPSPFLHECQGHLRGCRGFNQTVRVKTDK